MDQAVHKQITTTVGYPHVVQLPHETSRIVGFRFSTQSTRLSKNDEGDNVLSLGIPREAFDVREPVQAYLVSVPVWLPGWHALFQ